MPNLNKKQIFTIIALLVLGVSIPLTLFLVRRRTQIAPEAADFAGYDVFCEADPQTAVLRVSDPVETYDKDTGDYTLNWTVRNVSSETQTIHAELFSCRCPQPNAQPTPDELLEDPTSAYPGRLCIGDFPNTMSSDPPTTDQVLSPWNYCEYAYGADPDKYPQIITEEKQERASETTGLQNEPLVLDPGEEQSLTWTVDSSGVGGVKHCGAFQIDWNIFAVEGCDIRRTPGQIQTTAGVLITGDGQVDGQDYSDWRPEGVSDIGGVCEEQTTEQHNVCNTETKSCETVSGPGEDECSIGQNDSQTGVNPACEETEDIGFCDAATESCNFSDEILPGSTLCGADEDCCFGPDCPSEDTHLECVEKSCQTVSGEGRDKCSVDSDCTESICTANNVCSEVAITDLETGDIFCDEDSECNVHSVCVGKTCELIRGEGADECSVDVDCEVTYLACEGQACVEKEGDKEDQCSTDTDCFRNVCDENDQCVPIADASGRADQCQSSQDCVPEEGTHTECVDNLCKTVEGRGQDQCSDNTDCYDTYFACDTNTCVEKFGEPGPGEELCEPGVPNECKDPDDDIPTGVNGAALGAAIFTVLLFLGGLALTL